MALRWFQRKAIDTLYANMQLGMLRNNIWLATGGGKSFIYIELIKDCLRWGLPVVLIMRRRQLISQASNALTKQGIPHGVYMATDRRYNPSKQVQISSIDTLGAREVYPHQGNPNVHVIIDESHDLTLRSKKYARILSEYNGPVTGLTATPFRDNSMWDDIIQPVTPLQLMEEGYLTPCRTWVPNLIDVSGVTIKSNGDYDESELSAACSKSEVVGDIVSDWKRYGAGKRTILFAVDIANSKLLCEAFNLAGVKAMHCDANTSLSDREYALRLLAQGKLDLLSNVNIFSTGTDVVEIEAVQFARPTQSVIYWLQAVGRGLRIAPHIGKEFCTIIDNAGNTLRHGSPYLPRTATIEKASKRNADDGPDVRIKLCKQCGYIYEPNIVECPECGFINPRVVKGINMKEGDLVEYEPSPEELDAMNKKIFISDYYKLTSVANKRGFAEMWVYFNLKKKHGIDNMRKYGKAVGVPHAFMA